MRPSGTARRPPRGTRAQVWDDVLNCCDKQQPEARVAALQHMPFVRPSGATSEMEATCPAGWLLKRNKPTSFSRIYTMDSGQRLILEAYLHTTEHCTTAIRSPVEYELPP